MPSVLVVDEAREFVQLLSIALTNAGLSVISAHDPSSGLDAVRRQRPDVAIVDVSLGPWSGLDLLKQIRGFSAVPVILLTESDDANLRAVCVSLGASACLSKPFAMADLLGLVRGLLQPAGQRGTPSRSPAQLGNIKVDGADRSVTVGSRRIELSVIECRVLESLLSSAGKTVALAELAKLVWGQGGSGGGSLARAAVGSLRQKLGDSRDNPRLLVDDGQGYRLDIQELATLDGRDPNPPAAG